MPGTGLPTEPDVGGVLAQPPREVDAAGLSSASAWQSIANSGEKLANAAGKEVALEAHLQQAGWNADFENTKRRQVTELASAHYGDPEGYKAAADQLFADTIDQVPSWAAPHAKQYLGGLIESGYATQLNVKRAQDDRLSASNLDARRQLAENDVLSVYADPKATPDQQTAATAAYDGVLRSMVSTKVISEGQAQLYTEKVQTQATGALIRNDVADVLQKEGTGPALDKLNERLDGLNVPLRMKDVIRSQTMTWLHAQDAQRRLDLRDARGQAAELSAASATGEPVQPDQVDAASKALTAAGDPAGAARLLRSFVNKPLNDAFGQQPIADQTAQIAAVRAGHLADSPNAHTAYDFFTSRGYTPAQASGIVGNLLHESGLNPQQTHDGNTGLGIAGWRGDRLKALQDYAAAQGKPATDLQTQLEFVDKELRTSESGAGAKLGGAQTAQDAGGAFIHYERPLGYDPNNVGAAHGYANRVGLSRAVAAVNGNGSPEDAAAMQNSPAGSLWLMRNRSIGLDKQTNSAWTTVMKDWDESKIRPTTDAINQIMDAAQVTGNVGLLERMQNDLTRIQDVQASGQQSVPQQSARVGALNAAAQSGALSPGQAPLLHDLTQRRDAVVSGLENNPISTVTANFSDRFQPLAPINPADSQQFQAGLQLRGQRAQFGAQNYKVAPLSALDKSDLVSVKATLDSADPATKARMFADMAAALPEDVLNATLGKIAENGGPNMAVSVAAGAMQRSAPEVAQSILRGQQAIKANPAFWPVGAEGHAATEMVNKVLPPNAFGVAGRTDPQGPYAVAEGMLKARYADLSAQSGDASGKLNNERMTQAASDVTGGVLNHNGSPFIAPARGMQQVEFDQTLAGISQSDLPNVTTLNGAAVTPDYLRTAAQLESVGDGRYLLRLGKDPEHPIYAYQGANTEAPRKFVLDLRNRPLAPSQPYTDAVLMGGMTP